MNLVVFLQNAWSPTYAGREWPRESWLQALEHSRSGQRLKVLIDDLSCCENSTPIVGDSPSSIIPADTTHILRVLRERKPTIVVTCGGQATDYLKHLWRGPLLALPHPAYRVLQDKLYLQARAILQGGFCGRLRILQRKEGGEICPL